jgi:hypothetical protein
MSETNETNRLDEVDLAPSEEVGVRIRRDLHDYYKNLAIAEGRTLYWVLNAALERGRKISESAPVVAGTSPLSELLK